MGDISDKASDSGTTPQPSAEPPNNAEGQGTDAAQGKPGGASDKSTDSVPDPVALDVSSNPNVDEKTSETAPSAQESRDELPAMGSQAQTGRQETPRETQNEQAILDSPTAAVGRVVDPNEAERIQ